MNRPKLLIMFILIFGLSAQISQARSKYIKTVEADFEEVFFDLQEAVIGRGLVIEHVGHVGKMLIRTSQAVTGSTDIEKQTYNFAKYLQFCSSRLTHKATNIDPSNLSMCPFILFAYETVEHPGQVSVGYHNPDFGNLDTNDPLSVEIHSLLKLLVDNTVADH